MAQDTKKREGHFNGHTWIVVIVAIVGLIGIAICEIFVGLEIIKMTKNLTSNYISEVIKYITNEITIGCLLSIPAQVIVGIIVIIKRITYIPKGEN